MNVDSILSALIERSGTVAGFIIALVVIIAIIVIGALSASKKYGKEIQQVLNLDGEASVTPGDPVPAKTESETSALEALENKKNEPSALDVLKGRDS